MSLSRDRRRQTGVPCARAAAAARDRCEPLCARVAVAVSSATRAAPGASRSCALCLHHSHWLVASALHLRLRGSAHHPLPPHVHVHSHSTVDLPGGLIEED